VTPIGKAPGVLWHLIPKIIESFRKLELFDEKRTDKFTKKRSKQGRTFDILGVNCRGRGASLTSWKIQKNTKPFPCLDFSSRRNQKYEKPCLFFMVVNLSVSHHHERTLLPVSLSSLALYLRENQIYLTTSLGRGSQNRLIEHLCE